MSVPPSILHVGDQVYGNVGNHGGAYAEYLRGDEQLFALNPTNLTMEEAAAVPLACETSYQALFKKASPPVRKGKKVFICGAGAANERDFGEELREEEYDLVYDCVGGQQQWIAAQRILKRGGSFITITGDDAKSSFTVGSVLRLVSSQVNRKFWSVFGSAHYQYILHFLLGKLRRSRRHPSELY